MGKGLDSMSLGCVLVLLLALAVARLGISVVHTINHELQPASVAVSELP